MKSWARCLSRVFEVDPLICARCGGPMIAAAAILDDKAIVRVLSHLGLPTDFPVLVPARSPPEAAEAGSQADASAALYDAIDPLPPDDDVQASFDD